MSCSQPTNVSLLRRPRPPVRPATLPPIISQRSLETNASTQTRISPAVMHMTSIASHQDGLQSPVPTMQSEYEPVFRSSQTSKLVKVQSQEDTADNTTIGGDTGEGTLSRKGLVLPYKPRGPDPFPMREPKRPPEIKREVILPLAAAKPDPEFTLKDFLLSNRIFLPHKCNLQTAILSKANYKKLTLLLEKSLMDKHPDSVNTVNITEKVDITDQKKRVPRQQILIEMKHVAQDRLKQFGLTSPGKFDGREKEVGEILTEIKDIGDDQGVGRKSQMSVFDKATTNVFHESLNQPGSSIDEDNTESIITPSELSILNCLMEGGYVLSLKAHFIPQLPELSPLHSSLVYLNLSFNELAEFPRDVLHCRDLQVLKLRNNPLGDLPHDISRLSKLRTLILSFCCLSALPISLFSITTLEFLDVSYNKLSFLPNEIKKLDRLRFLNVEGNELPGLPCGLLRLNLFRIRVRNNFMSPLFWRENSKNDPQRLADICLRQIKLHVMEQDSEKMQKLPADIHRSLNNFTSCDCCHGPMYGPGLKVIRPCTEIWGIKRIPFIFFSCSPYCYSRFIRNTDPMITDMIYGSPEEKAANDPQDNDSLGKPPSPREGAITA